MHILTHMHTIFTHNYTNTHLHMNTIAHTFTHTNKNIHACKYICTYSHVFTYIYICTIRPFSHHHWAHTYAYSLIHIHLNAYTKGCVCVISYQQRYNHKLIKTFPHSYIHRLFIAKSCTFTYSTAIFPESNYVTRKRIFLHT